MSKILFIINCGLCDENDGLMCSKFYNDLETAKNELKKMYEKTTNYKFFSYKITLYQLIGKEYIMTNMNYTYKSGKFVEHNYE
jgi:hypothetical protein